jgi:hypothetical protein
MQTQTQTRRVSIKRKENTLLRKEQIVQLVRSCINSDGIIDMGEFRRNYKKEYSLINHYFGSVSNLLNLARATKTVQVNNDKGNITLRNQLALDMIENLRDSGYSFEDIAKTYNVTRTAVNNLYHMLTK